MMRMRKLLAGATASMLLSCMMTSFPASAAETEGTYESLTYMNYGDGIVITDCDTSVTTMEVPAEIDGVEVIEIGANAFYNCSELTSITLPETIVYISSGAFDSCESLTTIQIPARTTMIGDEVFEDCNNLESITVAADSVGFKSVDGVLLSLDGTTLLRYPIAKAGNTYAIPDGVTSVYECAFDECNNLTEISIPASMNNYLNNFRNCTSLATITVAEDNTFLKSVDGILYTEDGSTLLCYPAGNTDEFYTVTDGTVEIGNSAFYGNLNLLSIILPEGVTKIGVSAFYDCWNVQSITLPETLTSIGSDAFGFCYDLTALQIPSGVTEIDSWAFPYCSSLTELTLPEGITSIGAGMFQGCSSLTSFDVPDTVTYIDMYAFYDCTALTEISIPAGVTEISGGAFDGCTALTDVYFAGTEAEWNAVTIDSENDPIQAATVHFGSGAPVVTPPANSSLGDLNGDGSIDSTDASMILVAATNIGAEGTSGLTAEQEAAADVNDDSAFDAVDASCILQYATYIGTGGTDSLEVFVQTLL